MFQFAYVGVAAGAVQPVANPVLPASLSASASEVDPTPATAFISFNPNGTITDDDAALLGYWTDEPASVNPADFRVKYNWTSGSNINYPAGASDDVYTSDISSSRVFQLTQGFAGSSNSGGTFTVEKISTTATDTATGSFSASVS